jgi:hypothetical protein
VRVEGLGYLVGIARGWQTRADVKELPDATLTSKVADDAGQERSIGPRTGHHLRAVRRDLLGRLPVGRKVIFAPEPYVVDPGRVSEPRVEPGGCDVASCRPCLVLVCARSRSHAGDATVGPRPM